MKTLHTAKVIAMGGRNGRVKAVNGCIQLPLTSYDYLGRGKREGTNPEQLFGAAYSACFGSLLELLAQQQAIELQPNFSVTSKVSLQRDTSNKFHLEISLDCYLPDLSEAEATKLIYAANEICPYSNAMRNNVKIVINLLNDEE